jgi:uroporphyrinogen-III synthase
LPEDVGALETLVRDILDGRVDVVAITSQVQIRHLFLVATEMEQAGELTQALNTRTIVASIGPTSTAALQSFGVTPQVVPEHPKMGQLVIALAQYMEKKDAHAHPA